MNWQRVLSVKTWRSTANVDKLSWLLVETDILVTLGTAWSEMKVAQEELQQQNSELAAAVSALEADRKRARSALHESESRFRFLVEGIKEYAIFRLDTDGCVVSWNAEAAIILGYQAAEIIPAFLRPKTSIAATLSKTSGQPWLKNELRKIAGMYGRMAHGSGAVASSRHYETREEISSASRK